MREKKQKTAIASDCDPGFIGTLCSLVLQKLPISNDFFQGDDSYLRKPKRLHTLKGKSLGNEDIVIPYPN